VRYRVFKTIGDEALRIPGGNTKKMQIPVGSPEKGTVKKVFVAHDQFLNEGDPIVELG
jgi:multidrug efflux pump subunit AcrA (membrane-fusion protein)